MQLHIGYLYFRHCASCFRLEVLIVLFLHNLTWAQLISGVHSAGSSSSNVQADSPFPYAELFSGEALQLQRPKATVFGVTCDGITQEYCTKPGQFYPRYAIINIVEELLDYYTLSFLCNALQK